MNLVNPVNPVDFAIFAAEVPSLQAIAKFISRYVVSMSGPHFCATKITQDVREYAASHGLKEEEALTRGMEEKAEEFVAAGGEIYQGIGPV